DRHLSGNHHQVPCIDLEHRRIRAGGDVLARPGRLPLQWVDGSLGGIVHLIQPFTAPERSPSTTNRQTMTTSTSVGTMAMKMPVFSRLQLTSVLRASAAITTETGRVSASPDSSMPNMNSE